MYAYIMFAFLHVHTYARSVADDNLSSCSIGVCVETMSCRAYTKWSGEDASAPSSSPALRMITQPLRNKLGLSRMDVFHAFWQKLW